MSNGRKFLLALVAIVVLGLPALAQERKGAITGTVKDSGNSALQGALVELLPLGRKLVTDNQGQFRIPDVPEGGVTRMHVRDSEWQLVVCDELPGHRQKLAERHLQGALDRHLCCYRASRPAFLPESQD